MKGYLLINLLQMLVNIKKVHSLWFYCSTKHLCDDKLPQWQSQIRNIIHNKRTNFYYELTYLILFRKHEFEHRLKMEFMDSFNQPIIQ